MNQPMVGFEENLICNFNNETRRFYAYWLGLLALLRRFFLNVFNLNHDWGRNIYMLDFA
jgi:hypothetical protein